MQEIHATVGGGRVPGIAVAGGGGDRRIRAHQQSQHHIQALKCPRCESLNTKFCYYNNYNLSQPRHFCKNCRRYWTKGGVLRNVPVGGGSRKPKRSSKTKKPPLSPAAAAAAEPSGNSSSDGSSVTASNPAAVTAVADPASENLSVPVKSGSDSKLYGNRVEWPEMMGQVSPEGEMIPEVSGLTRVVATSSEEMTRFGFDGNSVNQQCLDGNQKTEIQLDDRTAGVDFTGRPSDLSGGFGALDWGGGIGDQGLFDLSCTVDHAYWSQNQWSTDFLP